MMPADPAGDMRLRILVELNNADLRIGAVNDALDLAQLAAPCGAEFVLCGPLTGEFCREAARRGIETFRAVSRTFSRRSLPLYGLDVLRWLRRLHSWRADVVHLNYAGYGPSLACAAWISGRPVVARAGGPFVASNPANRWIAAYAANCRPHAADLLASPLADRVVVTGDLFRPERLRATMTLQRALPPKSRAAARIVFLGQLVERKGLHVLIDAFTRVDGAAELVIVGGDWSTPGYAQRIRGLVNDFGLSDRVHMENHREDIAAILATADVFVLPSLSEARPRSIIEAMSLGVPVVASSVGGIPSLIADGVTGLLAAPADPEALASALNRLVRSPALREQIRTAARRHVERECRPDHTAREYVRLYRRLMTRSGTASPELSRIAGL